VDRNSVHTYELDKGDTMSRYDPEAKYDDVYRGICPSNDP